MWPAQKLWHTLAGDRKSERETARERERKESERVRMRQWEKRERERGTVKEKEREMRERKKWERVTWKEREVWQRDTEREREKNRNETEKVRDPFRNHIQHSFLLIIRNLWSCRVIVQSYSHFIHVSATMLILYYRKQNEWMAMQICFPFSQKFHIRSQRFTNQRIELLWW